jgi:hypothetical protein
MKKILSLSLIGVLTMSLNSPTLAAFSDVRAGTDFESKVEYLNEKGIMQGYSDGSFGTTKTINRAEALKIIFESVGTVIASETKQSASNSPFPDVPSTAWFAPYVAEAKNRGLIQGYKDGSYKPDNPVNRVEFIKMAMSALPFYSTIQSSGVNPMSQYSDLQPNQWYLPYVSAGLKMNFLSKADRLKPDAPMQRQDAAVIVYHIAKYMEENPGASSTDGTPFVPDEEFVELDPTKDEEGGKELGVEDVEIIYGPNSTDIVHRLHGYELNFDKRVDVSTSVTDADATAITFDDGCLTKIYMYEGESINEVYEQMTKPSSFMTEYESRNLKKLSTTSIEAYEVTITWDDHDWKTVIAEVPNGVIDLNTAFYDNPKCVEKSVTEILPGLSTR